MLKVAITGGIGTGKTTVAKLFELQGIPVYYSDERAKLLMHSDEHLKKEIKDAFGADSYSEEGQLNRAYLAEKVFKDSEQLALLNSFVHPAVARDQENWFSQLEATYALVESAIIVEIGRADDFDKLIVVDATETIRIERVSNRDGANETSIRKRMEAQMPQSEKLKHAHFIVQNDGDKSLIKQVLEIDQQLQTLVARS